jgi:hypothetical protein
MINRDFILRLQLPASAINRTLGSRDLMIQEQLPFQQSGKPCMAVLFRHLKSSKVDCFQAEGRR